MKRQLKKVIALLMLLTMGSLNYAFVECGFEDGYFPHENDCSKFYQCSGGMAIEMECAPGLEFNATMQACDWPASAGCEGGGSAVTCGKFISDGTVGIENMTSLETVIIAAQSVSFNANAQGSMAGRSIRVASSYANKTIPISQGYYKECEDFDLFNSCNLANEGYMIPCP